MLLRKSSNLILIPHIRVRAERAKVAEAARVTALSLIMSSMALVVMACPSLLDQTRENLRMSFFFHILETSDVVLNLRWERKVSHLESFLSAATKVVVQVFLSSLKRA